VAEVVVTGAGAVEADPGVEVVIRLPENASTGYVWSLGPVGTGLELVGDTSVPRPAQAQPHHGTARGGGPKP
jgi:inhibitor of cysteine peptidase